MGGVPYLFVIAERGNFTAVYDLTRPRVTRGAIVVHALVDIQAVADGSVVVRPHGIVGDECAVELRQVLVHAVRRLRPHRLILDLSDVRELDSINVGTVAAICDLAADHDVALFVDNSTTMIASHLHDAGVHHRHLRNSSSYARQQP